MLMALTAATRIAFRSHYLYDIDSVNYALALKRFDPILHQPHPPGYFLYVCLGRLANFPFQDANTALVSMSIVFSCLAVAMIYVLAREWFDRQSGLSAGAIFVFSPLAWFHGTVALTYAVELFFSALLGYLCWRLYSGKTGYIVPAAIVLGIATGFRPSAFLLLSPLFFFSLHTARRSRIAVASGCLTLTLLAWILPMLRMSGGPAYWSSLLSLWLTVPSKATVFNSSMANSFARAVTIVVIYFLCFGCAALLPLVAPRIAPCGDRRKTNFTLVWLAPSLLFFTFIYLLFVNSGYLLLLAPPACIWMGAWGSSWYRSSALRPANKLLLLSICAAINTAIFIAAPVYCSFNQTRRFEARLKAITAALPEVVSPADTMIVGFDSHFLGYRHAGFYLPDYLTVQFPAVQLSAGPRIFEMRHRATELRTGVTPPESIRSFVLFPLPSDDREYNAYINRIMSRFPAGDLRIVVHGGCEFIVGPIEDLRYLF